MRLLFALSLVLLNVPLAGTDTSAAEGKYLRYEDFIGAVESGQIKEVQLDQYSKISGIQRNGDKEEKFESYAGGVGTANDPLLLRLLVKHEVKVSVVPRKDYGFWDAGGVGSILIGLVTILLPLLTFVYVVVTYRRLRSVAASLSGRDEM